ncbi:MULTISPECIES: PLDc N-terminal domain-containing protein [Pontibacillus]|uniref:PLDc N-terminal domain-containing protein n=1 Tax=Pontibacillus chungwhensis TaxID=265426 RepID=A0ABY8UYA4_9BACI|nr:MULTISPECIES: PLDc N-terminal domain-containing protein [Pontibacillus]MCD5325530.1 PLDc N-terminal domain-containing protein [Pontibacillus sp. HN14]WIF98640.1 PLDc N-terminal domain-containing protein [Pontibacillus chungwhensis]
MTEIFQSIPWVLIAPILVIEGILLIVALIDWVRTEQTNGPKWVWLLVIVLLNLIGPILYFIFGRSNDR